MAIANTTFLRRLQQGSLIVGAIGCFAAIIGILIDRQQFFLSYLLAYMYWLNIGLGCLGLVMLNHLASGRWGFVLRRINEAGMRTLPLLAILFIPILLGMSSLYPWVGDSAQLSAKDTLHFNHSQAYLNTPFFIVRAVIYFILWIWMAYLLSRWSRSQDGIADGASLTRKMFRLSGPGLVIYVFSMLYASVDWVMSLEPEWWSTIYGLIFVTGQVLGSLAFGAIILRGLAGEPGFGDVVEAKHFHDVGNMILAFVILWAYMSFSQLLIIWSGNLPDEIPFYLSRLGYGWRMIALVLLIFHFIVPFVVLLIRKAKRVMQYLAWLSVFLLVMRYVDLYWVIEPSVFRTGLHFSWLDIVLPVGMGGVWLWMFVRQLLGAAFLPQNDPRFAIVPEEATG